VTKHCFLGHVTILEFLATLIYLVIIDEKVGYFSRNGLNLFTLPWSKPASNLSTLHSAHAKPHVQHISYTYNKPILQRVDNLFTHSLFTLENSHRFPICS